MDGLFVKSEWKFETLYTASMVMSVPNLSPLIGPLILGVDAFNRPLHRGGNGIVPPERACDHLLTIANLSRSLFYILSLASHKLMFDSLQL